MIHLAAVLYIIISASNAFAELRPALIKTQPDTPETLIFARDNESLQQAFERFTTGLDQVSNLKSVSGATTKLVSQYNEMNYQLDTVVIMANNAKDFGGETERMRNLKTILQDARTQVVQVPVGLLSQYTPQERLEIKKWINKNSRMMIVPGGDDIDPSLYAEKNSYSRSTNLERDKLELEIVKSYIEYKKGFTLGICRGHQLISALLGYKLIQDIPIQTGHSVRHADDWHKIEIATTRKNTLARILNLKPESQLLVNSLHHQSVVYKPGGPLELAATTSDKTTEALEFKNGHGLTLQFHPEYMNNKTGEQILTGLKAVSTNIWKSCKTQFR